MKTYHIVLDTNVLIAALRSKKGAAYRLLMLLGDKRFKIHLSVPLVLEYEDAAKRLTNLTSLTADDIDAIIDYLCSVGGHWNIFYLWRPVLRDPKDEMLLELAIRANCDFIVTYNTRDFAGSERFGVRAITPQTFLRLLGEIS